MPITLRTTTLKFKDRNGLYHSADCIKGESDIALIEEVSGATPSITGMPNVRYICDTAISELTITPPASGSIVVRFTAGSNCIVSLPQTVKLPVWFDISSLEAGTTYEFIITDGVYGGVMSWA